jgi:hypothetical protein
VPTVAAISSARGERVDIGGVMAKRAQDGAHGGVGSAAVATAAQAHSGDTELVE